MYTQCSKCETVFKLSAEVLRTAGGQVRCGKCGEVFSALARLAEDSSAFAPGESPLELETRADSILESVGPAQGIREPAEDNDDFAPPGVEIARIEILDWPEDDQAQNADDDRALEFTLPPGELDRIFVESKKAAPLPIPAPAPQLVPPLSVAPQPEPQSEPQPEPQPATQPAPHSAQPSLPEVPPHPESVSANVPPTRNRVSGFDVPEEVRREMLSGFEELIQPALETRGSAARRYVQHRPFILWLGAAIASALLLLAQVVHQNREWFVAHARGPFGFVRALYGAAGSPLPAPSNLSAYQLRQWGVTGDPDANGTLRLRASILNAAAQLQPFPLLRVTFADRFGKSIGTRNFEPSEYMGKPTARLLAPGERVDATLEILDPGKSAEGFEIDVCLHGVDRRIACANDVAAQAQQ